MRYRGFEPSRDISLLDHGACKQSGAAIGEQPEVVKRQACPIGPDAVGRGVAEGAVADRKVDAVHVQHPRVPAAPVAHQHMIQHAGRAVGLAETFEAVSL